MAGREYPIGDLLFFDILGAVLILTILIMPELKTIRIAIGVPFVLFLPGYFLTSALFPRGEELENLERVALSLGLSLALVPLIGLILNYTPYGIRMTPTMMSLYGFMLGMTIIAQIRRGELSSEERYSLGILESLPKWGQMSSEDRTLVFGTIIAIVGAGAIGTFLNSSPQEEGFTQFYILGEGGKMENYPTDLDTGENVTIVAGIQNHEFRTVNYRMEITLDNQPVENVEDVELQHEENWESPITFQSHDPGENKKLEFLLFIGENLEPYRKLHLWIDVENRK